MLAVNLHKTSVLSLLIILGGCGGGGSSSNDTQPQTDGGDTGSDNTPFSIDAGFDQVLPNGYGATQLTATASSGGSITWEWQQTSGTSVTLENADTAQLGFTTPTVSANETLVFEVKAALDGAQAIDMIRVEMWVPPSNNNDLTALGDFTGKSGWACNQNPVTDATLTISQGSGYTRYQSNGIANHATGTFPNAGNPNTIQQVSHSRDIPTAPANTGTATEMAEFGITLDGVKLERDTAESYNNARQWNYEALTPAMAQRLTASSSFDWLGSDCNNAHVQPTGAYRYHGLPESLINRLGEASPQTTLILGGYAADGFPLYLRYGYNLPNDASSGIRVVTGSWQVKSGTRPSGPGGSYDGTFREDWEYIAGSGDLDQCNGRVGVTPEYPDGTYHYYMTDDYPYIPRCVMGTPDPTFRTR